jgi:hypothetical protein
MILRSDTPETTKLPVLHRYKAKIVRLHARQIQKVTLDSNAHYKPTLFHILKMVNRRETRTIHHVQDQQGSIVTRTQDFLNNFVTHLSQKYGPIPIENTCVDQIQSVIHPPCPSQYSAQLEQPITSENLLSALRMDVPEMRWTCSKWDGPERE